MAICDTRQPAPLSRRKQLLPQDLRNRRGQFHVLLRFGALGAKGEEHVRHAIARRTQLWPVSRPSHFYLGWPVGSLTQFAAVVDLPLATTALQNVFGTSETPVFPHSISSSEVGVPPTIDFLAGGNLPLEM